MKILGRVVVPLLIALTFVAGGLVGVNAQRQTKIYTDEGGDRFVATSGGVVDIRSGSTSTFAGELIFGQQSETVTATWVITPTSPYIVLTSSAEYTSSTSTPIVTTTATAGQVVILRNGNASDVINIDGTGGTVECKANVAIGASDTLTLIFNGTDWNCVSSYDNS